MEFGAALVRPAVKLSNPQGSVEVAVLGSPSLIVLTVSDLERVLPELSRDGRPGLPVPNSHDGQ